MNRYNLVVEIDKNIVRRYANRSRYSISYRLVGRGIEKRLRGACFSDMPSHLRKKHYTSVVYSPSDKTEGLKKKWIAFCKSIGLLPDYIKASRIFKIKMTPKTPPSLIYTYLCALRHLQDEDGFIKITLYLVSKGMNPFLAMSAASGITIHNSGHHFMNIGGGYGSSFFVDVGWARSMRLFLRNPCKYDKRSPWTFSKSSWGDYSWSCHRHIRKASQLNGTISLQKAFKSSVVVTGSDSSARNFLRKQAA